LYAVNKDIKTLNGNLLEAFSWRRCLTSAYALRETVPVGIKVTVWYFMTIVHCKENSLETAPATSVLTHFYFYSRRNTPRASRWKPKLEIAKLVGSEYYQLSQAHREKGKPYGLAGCLSPQTTGFTFGDCSSNNSHWRFGNISANRVLLIHRNTGKCIGVGNDNVSTVLANCSPNDKNEQWDIEIEKDWISNSKEKCQLFLIKSNNYTLKLSIWKNEFIWRSPWGIVNRNLSILKSFSQYSV